MTIPPDPAAIRLQVFAGLGAASSPTFADGHLLFQMWCARSGRDLLLTTQCRGPGIVAVIAQPDGGCVSATDDDPDAAIVAALWLEMASQDAIGAISR